MFGIFTTVGPSTQEISHLLGTNGPKMICSKIKHVKHQSCFFRGVMARAPRVLAISRVVNFHLRVTRARGKDLKENIFHARKNITRKMRVVYYWSARQVWVKEAPSVGRGRFPQTCRFFFVNKLHNEAKIKPTLKYFD